MDTANHPVKSNTNSGLAVALRMWVSALGSDRVKSDDDTLRKYSRSLSNYDLRPVAILYPESTAEVQTLITVAGEQRIPIHVISRGKNWGYGDACAPLAGQAIIDLSRMNKVLEVNSDLCYARIEAGVSQGELHRHLKTHNYKLWMDSTAAGPEASIVGNTLDRGYGHTRYGDRSLQVCNFTVVLPDGSVLKTGFGQYENSQSKNCYRGGVGPAWEGLFFQSNYGIVTEMTVWLMPEPEYFSAFFFAAQNESDLEDIIERLRPLKQQGLLPSAVHVANDLRIFSGRTRYPWSDTKTTPLPEDIRKTLGKKFGVGAWMGMGSLCGSKSVVKQIEAKIKRALKPYSPMILNDQKMKWIDNTIALLRPFGLGAGLAEKAETVKPIYDLLKGIPSGATIQGAEWRVRSSDPLVPGTDPLDSHAGLIWVSPVLPMTGISAREVLNIMKSTYGKYGFDHLITFTLITDRALCAVSNVAFDKRDSAESATAKKCYFELYDRLIERGYVPYRSGPAGFPILSSNGSRSWELAGQFKKWLDPQDILSPGRYIPSARSHSEAKIK